MKTEVFLVMGGLAIFAIILSLFLQMQSGQDIKKNSDTNKLTVLGDRDEKASPTPKPTAAVEPPMTLDNAQDYKAVIKTSEGDITIDLFEEGSPITVNNFVYLARTGFYDGTMFHRVIKDFMIQGGDPKGDGTGGPGYKFDDELFEGEYTRGIVAMANSGPNTNGSQFFIMHADAPSLPKNYVIFGTVTEGLNVVDLIAESEVTASRSGENSKPVEPVVVESISITEVLKVEDTPTPAPEEPTAEPTPGTEETPTPTEESQP